MPKSATAKLSRNWSPLWMLSIAAFLLLIVSPLLRQGMFLDGIVYAAIAKNLSLDHGTIWQPFYSSTLFPIFYEHPPLALYLESLLFRIFGTDILVENIYSFTMILAQIVLLSWYWLKQENKPFNHLPWLLLLWLMIPLNTHVFTNNMLETTLTVFTTFASFLLLYQSSHRLTDILILCAASVAILLGFLANGPTAFFPIAIPTLTAVIYKQSLRASYIRTFLLVLILSMIFGIFFWLVPQAWLNIQHYLHTQVLPSIFGQRAIVFSGIQHLHVLYLYCRATCMVSIFSLIIIIWSAILEKKSINKTIQQAFTQPGFLLFFFLSLIAALPVGLSHRQAFNYIAQAAPFITLAALALCYQPSLLLMQHCAKFPGFIKAMQMITGIILIAALGLTIRSHAQFNRDETVLKDMRVLIPYLQNIPRVSTSQALYEQWITAAYLARFSMIALEPGDKQSYYLALKNEALPSTYQALHLNLQSYILGIRRST